MLFSFMASQQGRILQAHYEGRNLVVRKPRLYDFTFNREEELQRLQVQQDQQISPESAWRARVEGQIELFLQFMACDPVEDITAPLATG